MPLLNDIRNTPLLWLLVLVPVVLVAHALKPEAHTLLFFFRCWRSCRWQRCSAARRKRWRRAPATRSAACSTRLGQFDRAADRAGGIARRAIRTGEGLDRRRDRHQYLVHARRLLPARRAQASSQEYNRDSARLQTSLLFLATVAILVPSVVADHGSRRRLQGFTHTLSASLAVVLIITYALGLLFSLKTHREFFGAAQAWRRAWRGMAECAWRW